MLKPYGKHVLVRRDAPTIPPDIANRFGDGRIIIPDIAKAKSRAAKVLSVGPKVREKIRKGDCVLITWLDGTPFEDDALGRVEVLHESEILAVVTP